MSANQQLLDEIRSFCKRAGMAATTFGQRAVHEWVLVERLERGGSVTLVTAERIRKFIADQDAAAKSKRRNVA